MYHYINYSYLSWIVRETPFLFLNMCMEREKIDLWSKMWHTRFRECYCKCFATWQCDIIVTVDAWLADIVLHVFVVELPSDQDLHW